MFYLFEDIENKKLNLLDKFFSLLFLLLPIALISGPFLSDLILSLIGIYFIFISFRDNLWNYYKNYFVYLFICFYLFILFNSIISHDPFFSLKSSVFYFRYLFFVLGASYLLKINYKLINCFLFILIGLTVIIFFDSLLQFLYGKNIFGWNQFPSRVSSLFGDNLVMGRYFSHIMPIMFALLLIQKKNNKKILFIGIVLLSLISIITFLSGERAAFINLFIASFIILLLTSQFRKYSLYLFILNIGIIFFLLISSSNLKDRFVSQSINQINNESGQYLLSREYEALFVTSFRMFKDKPILGHGPNLFRIKCADPKYNVPKWGCSTHPHNTYLQLLSEIGLIGTFPILLSFFIVSYFYIRQLYIQWFTYKKSILNDYQICLLASITITIFPLTTSLNFFNNWISILYYLPLCFLLINPSVNKANKLMKNEAIFQKSSNF